MHTREERENVSHYSWEWYTQGANIFEARRRYAGFWSFTYSLTIDDVLTPRTVWIYPVVQELTIEKERTSPWQIWLSIINFHCFSTLGPVTIDFYRDVIVGTQKLLRQFCPVWQYLCYSAPFLLVRSSLENSAARGGVIWPCEPLGLRVYKETISGR